MESTLSLLRGPRLQRLKDSNCIYLAPGVEFWGGFSNKSGTGKTSGLQKVDQVVKHFELIHEYVPGLGANFIFGLDEDEGDEPVELTKDFMTRTPFVWPYFNIPVPYGGTPFHEQYLREGRTLTAMPLTFYYAPHLVITLKHYSPIAYYEKLIELTAHAATWPLFWRRLRSTPNWPVRALMTLRQLGAPNNIKEIRRILNMLTTDSQFRAFHEGKSQMLPEFYHHEYSRMLGPYASLLSRADATPDLSPAAALPKRAQESVTVETV